MASSLFKRFGIADLTEEGVAAELERMTNNHFARVRTRSRLSLPALSFDFASVWTFDAERIESLHYHVAYGLRVKVGEFS